MKVTREQTEMNRQVLIAEAARLFRERGLDAVSVAEISQAAGMTHGAFYRHFASKTDIVIAACEEAFLWVNPGDRSGDGDAVRASFVNAYLSDTHRDQAGLGCPVASLAVDVSRADEAVSRAFAEGVEQYIARVQALFNDQGHKPKLVEKDALEMLATLVGGLVIARAVARGNPALSSKVLELLRDESGAHGADSAERSAG